MNIIIEADTTGFAPRDCRFTAHDDDTWDGAEDSRNRSMVGYGATPSAAITDLLELIAAEQDLDDEWLREAKERAA